MLSLHTGQLYPSPLSLHTGQLCAVSSTVHTGQFCDINNCPSFSQPKFEYLNYFSKLTLIHSTFGFKSRHIVFVAPVMAGVPPSNFLYIENFANIIYTLAMLYYAIIIITTYYNNTLRDDFPLILPGSPLLLSLEVLFVSPHT